jgi:hypothetical protein
MKFCDDIPFLIFSKKFLFYFLLYTNTVEKFGLNSSKNENFINVSDIQNWQPLQGQHYAFSQKTKKCTLMVPPPPDPNPPRNTVSQPSTGSLWMTKGVFEVKPCPFLTSV